MTMQRLITNTILLLCSFLEDSTATKILRNNQILIIRGDKTYTVHGLQVK